MRISNPALDPPSCKKRLKALLHMTFSRFLGDRQNACPESTSEDFLTSRNHYHTAAWMVYPSRAYAALKVRVFIDYLKKSLTDS
jgi:hypothetical protein